MSDTDDSHVAYRETRLGPAEQGIEYGVVSNHGLHLAYATQHGDEWVVVVDGKHGPEYDDVGPPCFSPDGNRVAHAARHGRKEFVVVDGQPGQSTIT